MIILFILLSVMIASLPLVFRELSQVIKIINNSCLLLPIQVVEYLNGKWKVKFLTSVVLFPRDKQLLTVSSVSF